MSAHNRCIRTLAYSADSHMLFSGSDDGTVRLYETTHCESVASLAEHSSYVLSVATAPDNARIATGYAYDSRCACGGTDFLAAQATRR